MPPSVDDTSPPGRDFGTLLTHEVERVLADPAFQRSPVQSRLLAWLAEQTATRGRRISQIAVAVDGLGRRESAGQATESYPRVQVSRLRRNLALYYARCRPGEGLAVYVRRGDYQLRLAPPDSAYGEPRARAEPAAPLPNRNRTGAALTAAMLFAVVAAACVWLALYAGAGGVEGGR
jgi:hypothetical protein